MIEINPGILIAQIVTFLAALFVLWKIAWGPLTKMMKSREENIRADISRAQEERLKAEELKKNYEEHLSNSRIEAQKIIAQASSDGEQEREKILATARGESEKMLDNARLQLGEEKNRLVKELRTDVAALAVQISEKLVRKSIDKNVQDRVFKDIVEGLGDNSKEKQQ